MPTTNVTSLGGLNKLKSFHNLRQKEVFCPVTKVSVQTTPLTTGDDLSLRTMVSSPDLYDREIAALIYKHTKFPEFNQRLSFDQFIDTFSSFDRKVILYGIYSATYDKIATDNITCPNCKHEFEDEIKSNEIVHPDLFSIWDKEKPFNEFYKEVEVSINPPEVQNTITSLNFITGIPSIRDHFNILKLVSPDKMKSNFDKTGQILSRSEELTLITKVIQVNSNIGGVQEIDNINDVDSVHEAISEYVSSDLVKTVVDQYNEEFNKYSPDFKKFYTCSNCGHEFDVPVNIELSLFRTFFEF